MGKCSLKLKDYSLSIYTPKCLSNCGDSEFVSLDDEKYFIYAERCKKAGRFVPLSVEVFYNIGEKIRVDRLPLPPKNVESIRVDSVEFENSKSSVEESKRILEKCIKQNIADEVAGKHYEFPVIKESIEIIELVMQRENLPRKASYMICNALKYILRAGVKTADLGKDIAKAENYLHRTLSGEWIYKNDS